MTIQRWKTNGGINQISVTIYDYGGQSQIKWNFLKKNYPNTSKLKEILSDEIIEKKNISLIYLNLKVFADHL